LGQEAEFRPKDTALSPLGERASRLAGTGEGVKAVNPGPLVTRTIAAHPRRKRRSPARGRTQIAKARDLRHSETASEEVAWRLLRGLRPQGFKFRRQHPVGRYLVDFCCPQRRLIVELEGSIHAQPSQAARDKRRDVELKRLGYAVARFSNGIVREAPQLFVEKVLKLVWSLPNVFTGEL